MAAHKTLEGEKFFTISLIPYVIATVHKGLRAVIEDEGQLQPVQALASTMLADYNARWGSGDAGTVFAENQIRGDRQRQKGLPIKTLLAAACDPRKNCCSLSSRRKTPRLVGVS